MVVTSQTSLCLSQLSASVEARESTRAAKDSLGKTMSFSGLEQRIKHEATRSQFKRSGRKSERSEDVQFGDVVRILLPMSSP